MSQITYEALTASGIDLIRVKLDGKMVGLIREEKDKTGWYYSPKKGTRGEKFPSIAACKRSLEG